MCHPLLTCHSPSDLSPHQCVTPPLSCHPPPHTPSNLVFGFFSNSKLEQRNEKAVCIGFISSSQCSYKNNTVGYNMVSDQLMCTANQKAAHFFPEEFCSRFRIGTSQPVRRPCVSQGAMESLPRHLLQCWKSMVLLKSGSDRCSLQPRNRQRESRVCKFPRIVSFQKD